MDRANVKHSGLKVQNRRCNRPDFEGFASITRGGSTGIDHPLMRRGGAAALAGVAMWQLGQLAKECLTVQGLSEVARLGGCVSLCMLMVVAMGIAAWFLRSGQHNDESEKTRKRSPKP